MPKYEILMTEGGKPEVWKRLTGHDYVDEAIESAADLNRNAPGGSCIHKVVRESTGEELYRRGWIDDDG